MDRPTPPGAPNAAIESHAMNPDPVLDRATRQIESVLRGEIRAPRVRAFFDEPTVTASYVVHDPATGAAVIIDPVLDFDAPSGRTTTESADKMIQSA